ncbi:MAG TPA: hypothetical protein VF828_04405 [Patescibacteria group bacterium]
MPQITEGCKIEKISFLSSYDLIDHEVPASTAMFRRIQECGAIRLNGTAGKKDICAECPARRVISIGAEYISGDCL